LTYVDWETGRSERTTIGMSVEVATLYDREITSFTPTSTRIPVARS